MLNYLRFVKAPLILLAVFIALQVLSIIGLTPSFDKVSFYVKDLLDSHGLIAVAILSFTENIFGINAYFPGSIIILTAMAATAGNPLLGFLTYLTISLFAFIAYHVNYIIGRLLFTGKNKYGESLSGKSNLELWLLYLSTFWHPHFTALTCIMTGSEGFSYRWFIMRALPVGFLWNSFWGFTMYNFGVLAKENLDLIIIMYVYFIGWVIVDTYKFVRTKKNRQINNDFH